MKRLNAEETIPKPLKKLNPVEQLEQDKRRRPRRLWEAAPPTDPFSQVVWAYT